MLAIVVSVEVALLLTAPLLLVLAALLSAVKRSTRPLRSVALVLVYSRLELSTLARIGRGVDDWQQLLRDVLVRFYDAVQWVLGVRVVLEDGSVEVDHVARSDGVLVLARHCGPGDSLFVAWLLAVHYRLRLGVVLTGLLRLEPTVDIASEHLSLCFVGSGEESTRDRIREAASRMMRGDALLLFPEGASFTWPKWRSAIRRLEARGDHRAARRAQERTHTLPPHTGGVEAALAGAPAADVMLLAHSGLGADARSRPWWRVPMKSDLLVRTLLVPRTDVPATSPALDAWLETTWAQVDTWAHGREHLDELAANE